MDIPAKLGFETIRWQDDHIVVLDQRELPAKEIYISLSTVEQTANAISDMAVRGAPLIGIAATYGLCLVTEPRDEQSFQSACKILKNSRPTAVNLASAVHRMRLCRERFRDDLDLHGRLVAEARAIHDEDRRMCDDIGRFGNEIIPNDARILTHCNAGALATGGIGTALGVIYTAFFSGKKIEVWACETRPRLQGSKLTAWELSRAGVPVTLIADNMAGRLMADRKIDMVLIGADRIARNFDFANKTGTYSLAVLAGYHKIPFYCAAPSTTFDSKLLDGSEIPIEHRNPDELRRISGVPVSPSDCHAYNPAFDVTPQALISGIITEKGIISPQ